MLGISPVTYNKSQSLSFGYNKKDVDQDINFYKEQVEELDQFLNEDYIPDKMKKPFKFFRTIANGAIDGLAVFGSTLMLASFVKKSGAKIGANKYFKQTVTGSKSVMNKIADGFKFVGGKIAEVLNKGFDAIVNSSAYKKFTNTNIGKKIKGDAAFIISKGLDMKDAGAVKSQEIMKKVAEPIKNINTDKAVKGTATVLGIGSGITGAYETTMRDDIKAEVDEGDDTDYPPSRDYEEDYDYYRESA
jgi:hypothetical protein